VALSFDVVSLRCSCRRGVTAQVFPCALCPPLFVALGPGDTREFRGAGSSVLHGIDAVHEVFAARTRRVLLRRVISELRPVAICLPFVVALAPGDALELRGARWSGNTAILEVLLYARTAASSVV